MAPLESERHWLRPMNDCILLDDVVHRSIKTKLTVFRGVFFEQLSRRFAKMPLARLRAQVSFWPLFEAEEKRNAKWSVTTNDKNSWGNEDFPVQFNLTIAKKGRKNEDQLSKTDQIGQLTSLLTKIFMRITRLKSLRIYCSYDVVMNDSDFANELTLYAEQVKRLVRVISAAIDAREKQTGRKLDCGQACFSYAHPCGVLRHLAGRFAHSLRNVKFELAHGTPHVEGDQVAQIEQRNRSLIASIDHFLKDLKRCDSLRSLKLRDYPLSLLRTLAESVFLALRHFELALCFGADPCSCAELGYDWGWQNEPFLHHDLNRVFSRRCFPTLSTLVIDDNTLNALCCANDFETAFFQQLTALTVHFKRYEYGEYSYDATTTRALRWIKTIARALSPSCKFEILEGGSQTIRIWFDNDEDNEDMMERVRNLLQIADFFGRTIHVEFHYWNTTTWMSLFSAATLVVEGTSTATVLELAETVLNSHFRCVIQYGRGTMIGKTYDYPETSRTSASVVCLK